MFNSFNFNSNNFNGLSGASGSVESQSNIVFNGYELQNSDIITQILIQDNTPERDFDTTSVPRGNGEIINGDFWRRKNVSVKGVMKKATNELLEAEIDAMKKALAVREGILDVKIAGVIRRYIATLVNGNGMFSERKGYHITFCPFEAEFACLTPFGGSVNYDSAGFIGETSLNLNEQINNVGTVIARPVVILNFVSASSVTVISFKNNTRSEEIRLTKSISAGDYVKFDSENLEVTVNGVVQDYEGAFPFLDTGANSVTIGITGVSAVYDLTIKHKTPYL